MLSAKKYYKIFLPCSIQLMDDDNCALYVLQCYAYSQRLVCGVLEEKVLRYVVPA